MNTKQRRAALLANIRAFWIAARAGNCAEAARLASLVGFNYCPSQFPLAN